MTGEKYTLSVTDTGNFDINVAGDYEISYALTEKESSVSETESVENTESADIIESTETVSGTETVDTTETIENTDQTPEGDDQNSDTDTADQDKPDQPADKDEADSAKDPADSGNAGQTQGTSTGVGEAQGSENQNDGNTDTVKERVLGYRYCKHYRRADSESCKCNTGSDKLQQDCKSSRSGRTGGDICSR